MTVYATINKEVIPYVCFGKKVTLEYLENSVKYQKSKLEKWLDVSDPSLPTILQAKKLAKCLHIPFASLYMNTNDIPIKSIPSVKNYRTISGNVPIDDSSLNIAICDVLLERDFLINQSGELKLSVPSLSIPQCKSGVPTDWAKMIRDHFSISSKDQFSFRSTRRFYLYLREKLENKGIFVQCFTDVPVEIVRGFAIFMPQLPIIGINDDDHTPAKSFSLIHELVHLIKRESSVCNNMYNTFAAQREEIFCNAVAGELLVPKEALAHFIQNSNYSKPYTVDTVTAIADKFSVSRNVIIRRLLDCRKISKSEYDTYSTIFIAENEQKKAEQRIASKLGINNGPRKNMSREAINRTSSAVCKTLYYGYGENVFSKREIAQHLGIAQKHVDSFLMEVSKWNS